MSTFLTMNQEECLMRYRESQRSTRQPVADPIIAYAGTTGSYAEEAAISFFGEASHRLAHGSFSDVFKSLTGGGADYGVLPIENSSTGSIAAVYDLLSRFTCSITGEVELAIHHCLMALPGSRLSDIREVYSHEQGFSQSADFLSAHPDWKCIPWHNTAIAAEMVAASGNPHFAAIASERAARLHGLTLLAQSINAQSTNTTRFVVVSPVPEDRPRRNKISLVFNLPHQVGALYHLLGIFERNHLNLCKIESRPVPGVPWEYLFFLDFLGEVPAGPLDQILREVFASTRQFYFLGNYEAAHV